MAVELFNVLDVSDKVAQRGRNSAQINDVAGILAQQRNYVITDNDGELNPFSPSGSLLINDWRNQSITETSDSGVELFTGSINSVGESLNNAGYQTTIQAREAIGVILSWSVDSTDITTHTSFTVSGAHSVGSQTITITGGSTTIPTACQVSFSDDLVPRYQVTSATGSPTTSIVLDRGIPEALSGGETVRIALPKQITIPGEIQATLISAGIGSKLGSSFSTLAAAESAASRELIIFVRREDKVSLASHIGKLLELGNMYLTISDSGIIDIVKGLAWDGTDIIDEITDDEMVDQFSIQYDNSRLYIGSDTLFLSGNKVKVHQEEVDNSLIEKYAGQNRWQPVSASSSLAIDYKYLYNSENTAQHYAQSVLDYFSSPRINVTCPVKPFVSGSPLRRVNMQLIKEFGLSFNASANYRYVGEPAKVVAYNFDDQAQRYSSVTFQLTNYPSPGTPREAPMATTPVIVSSSAISNGITTVFEPLMNTLVIRVYLEDQLTLILDTSVLYYEQGDGNDYNTTQNSALVNGQTYYVEYLTRNGSVFSDPTEKIKLVPGANGTAQWGSSAWGTHTWAA